MSAKITFFRSRSEQSTRPCEKTGNLTKPAKYSISFFLPREKSSNAPKIAEYFHFSCAVAIGIGAATGNQPFVLIGTAKKAVSRLIGGIQRQIELNLKQAGNEIIIYKYIAFSSYLVCFFYCFIYIIT